ncbi:alpha/beta fold hydrolase [Deinococcus peraridilitoris]|uniref:Putative hydrolase or acyltransferase of alpha/beta superfamily n=1 Tax=Deinococcus peraridilitoris (strain DSM 19664 / LMG 22246 / CIP 109416 / KR-200) TaxID=937777 RepID=L0A0U8_DEIPD|nr:alpha/beta hydrolase [Deinococcus peraridilitoris]AFZ67518.1 putative hydrolase or acyltransferase of alpha/beta superfamily [Deinococcus peraridilitoris DSM 19664]
MGASLALSRGGAGRPLIALHGNFASRAWWCDLVQHPPGGHEVLAPDLPGFADSPVSCPPDIGAYADAVEALVQELGLDMPALLGHSLGGAVALELASRAPERYAALVLAGSCPLSGLKTPEENYPVLELMRHNPALVEASFSALFPSGRPANFAQLVVDAGRMQAEHYSGNPRALERWQVAHLPKLPTLVLGGGLDQLATPELVRVQARALNARCVIFEECGHGFPQEAPQRFREVLEDFLGTLPLKAEAAAQPNARLLS